MQPIFPDEAAKAGAAALDEARMGALLAGGGGISPALDEEDEPQLVKHARVLDVGVYRGPHFYSHTPMIRIQLDLGTLEEWPSHRIPGFTDELLALLPGLHQHGCSYDTPGGLERRLREGTWLGHVIEHVALELQTVAGAEVSRGKTRSVRGKSGVYNIMYAYVDEPVGLMAGRLAIELVDRLLPLELRGCERVDRVYDERRYLPHQEAPTPAEAIDALRSLRARVGLGPTTRSLADEARFRGIPVMRLDQGSLAQLGHGRKQIRIRASVTSKTSSIASDIASDKELTKQLLKNAGVPVPAGVVVRTAQEAIEAFESLPRPLVCKPLDANHGRGVTLDITTEKQLVRAFELAKSHSSHVIVEEQVCGRDYRVLVVNGQVVAVAERKPAEVIGDGLHTVAELIQQVNSDPRRGEGHEAVMTRIHVDDHVREQLERQGMSEDSVPAPGRIIRLRSTANLSSGGIGVSTVRMVAHVLRATGLTVGMTSTGGIYVNEDRIVEVDASGPKSARLILQDPSIDAAVLEIARGGILREGLAFERCNAAAVLNISADHLGLNGVNTLEDLAAVKSLVLEVVAPGGCSVLNADDELVVNMQRVARGRIAYFSMWGGSDMSPLLRDHIDGGGLAVVREPGIRGGDDIVLYERGDRTRVMAVEVLPAALGGAAEFNIQNAMAAIAMTFAHGVPLRAICNALASFNCSYEQNPGRLNIYDGHGFRVIVDYAHNPAGLRELCKVVSKLRTRHRRRIGSISIPGDRRDEDIKQMGRIAAGTFDLLVFRERPDGRGRRSGEVNSLLRTGALEEGFPRECIHEVPDEHDATALCLRLAHEGDLVVLTPTDYDGVWRSVLAYRRHSERELHA